MSAGLAYSQSCQPPLSYPSAKNIDTASNDAGFAAEAPALDWSRPVTWADQGQLPAAWRTEGGRWQARAFLTHAVEPGDAAWNDILRKATDAPAPVAHAPEEQGEFRRPRSRKKDPEHGDLLRSNSGWYMDADDWFKRWEQRQVLDAQTQRIADVLESRGIPVRKPRTVTAIGAVTGVAEPIDAYRAVRFLPAIGGRDRRPMLNNLKLYLAEHETVARFCRYMVVTAGDPIPAFGNLRAAQQELSRLLSKWAHQARKEFGVETLFRGIEYTRQTAAERKLAHKYDDAETPLYHLHANLLTWPRRAMSKARWAEFLAWSWEFLGSQWRDNGRLENPNELIKYCMKPNEVSQASDDEIEWLFHQTTQLKTSQPLGPFRKFCADIKKAGQKVVRRREGDKSRLVRVKKAKRFDHTGKIIIGEEELRPKPTTREGGEPPKNMILGVALPQWRHTPWSEPVILVQHYDPTTDDEGARKRLVDLAAERREARADWDAAGAPDPAVALEVADLLKRGEAERAAFKVHKSRLTVRPERPDANDTTIDSETLARWERYRPRNALLEPPTVLHLEAQLPAELRVFTPETPAERRAKEEAVRERAKQACQEQQAQREAAFRKWEAAFTGAANDPVADATAA